VLVHTHSPPHVATVIGVPSYLQPEVYTIKFKDESIAEYALSENILEGAPVLSSSSTVTLLPDWIKDGSNVTLFLHSMTKPRHGKLYRQADSDTWTFCPGNSTDMSKVYHYLISHLIVNNYWILVKFFVAMPNSNEFIKHEISFNYVLLSSIMYLPTVYNNLLHPHP